MLLKILLTLAVIFGALLVLRRRTCQVQQSQMPHKPQPAAPKSLMAHFVAYGMVIVMLAGACFFIYLEWVDSYQVVNVQVIDTRTGHVTSYQARRSDVGERGFQTVDGRTVSLAEVERMELGGN
ncbi:hypothetical protein MNBD_GAMMA26-164 [hydrothermal vent metagenome]|uniref:Antitermination protein NusG n=1 Tax=hydrothermal vent metagenome TaxID=652676 RepID=A0A3B1BER0_9ZZZZ